MRPSREHDRGPDRREVVAGLGLAGLGLALSGPRRADAARPAECDASRAQVTVRRLPGNPVIRPRMDDRMGTNVQGPSLVRVPDWVDAPLGRYYLYFADHKGSFIRLAYADHVGGPWRTHPEGSLQLAESGFLTSPPPVPDPLPELPAGYTGFAEEPREGVPSPLESATKPHIASPDVHVREDRGEIVMYYHGLEGFRDQRTRVATSRDGIHFTSRPDTLGRSYFRAFPLRRAWYALAMPGIVYRSEDGLGGFVEGPRLFPGSMRHAAVLLRGNTLFVFWTRVGDDPEHILLSTIDVRRDWQRWEASEPVDVLFPERDWEGADVPSEPSVRDAINVRVRQLRDPAIYVEGERTWLLYAVAGESGIAIAGLDLTCE